MNNTNIAEEITKKANTAELAAAYKRILVTDNAVAGLYDISVEFIRKHGGSPWRRVKLVEGLKEEQAVAAVYVLQRFCIEETVQIDMKDHLPVPEKKKKGGYKTKVNDKPSTNPDAAGIVPVK